MGNIEIERFKEQADIVQLVEQYIPLKRRGMNFWATCPFHEEKTASFSVHPQRQIFKCFGCGKAGGIIDFVMEFQRVEFPEALRIIAEHFGLPMPELRGRQTLVQHSRKKGLEEIVSVAAGIFSHQLWNSEEGRAALGYLLQTRGFSTEVLHEWKVGFAHNSWDRLLTAMQAKGYSVEQQLEAGLLVKHPERPDRHYDRFRNRVMFPLFDALGRMVGFAGRSLDENIDVGMKYVNTPETLIYVKRKCFYGLRSAKNSGESAAVVVEGYTDALMAYQHGITNVVALGGIALTEDQAALLARHFETAVVCLDPDKAGEREAPKAARLLMQAGMKVRVMLLPGDDMDVILLREGAESVRKRIAEAGSLYDFELSKILRKSDPKAMSPDEKRDVLRSLVPLLSYCDGITQCRLYLQETAERLGIDYKVALAAFSQYSKPREGVRFSVFDSEQSELEALAVMLRTDYDALFKQQLGPEHFTNPARRALFRYLCSSERRVLYDLPALSPEPSMFDPLDIKPGEVLSFVRANVPGVSEADVFALLSVLQRHPAPDLPDVVLHRLHRAREARDLAVLEQKIIDARNARDSGAVLSLLQQYCGDYERFRGPPQASSGTRQQG